MTNKFKKILIANRGEIACRIISTCREMGITSVAVYSDADRQAAHVISADESVYLGASDPSESYLNSEKIITAAKRSGAEAIHPGYGFLAENGDFAEQCKKERIVFIGPEADVIKKLGDKITARKIMIDGGVPVTPGMSSAIENFDVVAKDAEQIGYPVLIKASAGGGGKGIRIVNKPEELKEAIASAAREAQSAFGNNAVYIEKFFTKAKHIEFQILADNHGNTIHLLERECSIQRRHQKIIEESPSPAVSPALRTQMGEAAVSAAKAAGYSNAGTVEFLLAQDNSFYFLEVNTRLQVEHPVTEMITGIDIVKHQIEIAQGKKLSLNQADISSQGHSIECRVYAEDPSNDFFPSPGKITYIKEPKGPGIRNDCGVYSGFEVPVNYDPIISKLIVHAENREMSIKKMIKALKEYVLIGVKTPIGFLIDVLNSKPFVDGDVYTDFIETNFSDWSSSTEGVNPALITFIIDEMNKGRKINTSETSNTIPSPWETLGNFRG